MKRQPAETENYGVGGSIPPLGTNNIKDLSQTDTHPKRLKGVSQVYRGWPAKAPNWPRESLAVAKQHGYLSS